MGLLPPRVPVRPGLAVRVPSPTSPRNGAGQMNKTAAELEALVAEVAALQAAQAELRQQMEQLCTAEAIIRRASYPESMLYGSRPPRPRHLRAV